MKIDGKVIGQKILRELKKSISKSRLHPTLSVILIGENPASISYIRQKEKAAEFIGAKLIIKKLSENTQLDKLVQLIEKLNKNPKVHGLIVQLPLPESLDPEKILAHITPTKDVDGFTPNSPFTPPVAQAVLKVLEEIQRQSYKLQVTSYKFLVIGRGLTAGQPIAKTLKKLGYQVEIAYSQTKLDQFLKLVKSADVIISCVGKPDIIKTEMLKKGAIVIGVGIHRTCEGKLAGDFNEAEIAKVASFYTPTPGGIGPVNVACLMENLVFTYFASFKG